MIAKNMLIRSLALAAVLACSLTLSSPTQAAEPKGKRGWQCAPYARFITPVLLRGNAWTWWKKAAGLYTRGNEPKIGAVLVMKRSPHMPMGHVAVVRRVVSDREVWIEHANWDRRGGRMRGRVSIGDRVVDVSEDNDWSAVRVWSVEAEDFGRVNATYGFIYSPNFDPRTGIEWQQAEAVPSKKHGDG